jgi:hypothetical protein
MIFQASCFSKTNMTSEFHSNADSPNHFETVNRPLSSLRIQFHDSDGRRGTALDAQIAKRAFILIFFDDRGMFGLFPENPNGANPDTFSARGDADTFFKINFNSNEFAHDRSSLSCIHQDSVFGAR